MKCPVCAEYNDTSIVYTGASYSSLVHCSPFYEDGIRHYHDVNSYTTEYRCSNGHRFKQISENKCPAPGCTFVKEGSVRVLRSSTLWDEIRIDDEP